MGQMELSRKIAGVDVGKSHLDVAVHGLEALKLRLASQILTAIKAHPDLLARYRLLVSLPGVGPIVAATLLIRMPELGGMRRGQAASLIGVAPFDRDSGQWKGLRFISGGRARPRRMLYLAAIMRKLIEAANLVLQRGQPWVKAMPA